MQWESFIVSPTTRTWREEAVCWRAARLEALDAAAKKRLCCGWDGNGNGPNGMSFFKPYARTFTRSSDAVQLNYPLFSRHNHPCAQGLSSHAGKPGSETQNWLQIVLLESAYPFILALILPFYICLEDESRMVNTYSHLPEWIWNVKLSNKVPENIRGHNQPGR